MNDHLIFQSNDHDSPHKTYTLSPGVTKLSLLIIFLLSFSLSSQLTYDKFTYSEDVSFSVIEGVKDKDYGVYGNYVVLWPDEILYINWIFTRADSFEKTLSGERGLSTNLYGYFISGIYTITGFNWKILFVIGVFNFILFFYSCLKLLNYFCKDRPILIIVAMALIALSPTVINLSSGFMRDLLLIAVVNFSLLSILNRKMFYFFLCLLLMFFIRNFMVVALVPLFLYFYFYYHRTIFRFNKSTFLLMISIIISLFMYISLNSIGAVNKSPFEILLRFTELITGLNLVVLNFYEVGLTHGAASVEILAHVYQFFIVICFYAYIIKRKLKVNSLLIPIFGTCLLLAILYGSFLGFFVARTKLIILWLLIFFFAFSENRKLQHNAN